MQKFFTALQHIDLTEATWGADQEALSIPSQLEETVLLAIEQICARNDIGMHGTETETQELGAALDAAFHLIDLKLQSALDDADTAEWAETALQQGRIYAAIAESFICGPGTTWYPTDDIALEALLVYQLDTLIGLHKAKNFDQALHIFTDICDIQREIAENKLRDEMSSHIHWQKSREAKERAKLRHQKMNTQKAAVLAEWDATGSEYESRADFARIVGGLHGLKHRTLYEWIAAHEKSKDSTAHH